MDRMPLQRELSVLRHERSAINSRRTFAYFGDINFLYLTSSKYDYIDINMISLIGLSYSEAYGSSPDPNV